MAADYGDVPSVWVFNGPRSQFPSGVFSALSSAESWIALNGLSGTLTRYPIDVGVYDWAVRLGHFKPRRDDQSDAAFIERFSSASQEHYHFENGRRG